MQANENQIGGSHYKSTYQHWDWVTEAEMPYLIAQITRYVSRWRKKNGIEDLEKAAHYMQKLNEVHRLRHKKLIELTRKFCDEQEAFLDEESIYTSLMEYMAGSYQKLNEAHANIQYLLKILRNKEEPAPREPIDPEFLHPTDEWRN